MMMLLAVMFIGSAQPLMMVISLIFITLFYSLLIMNVMGSFWFSYALIMIMLSGMFVVFMYMTSLMPNEEFEMYSMVFFVMFIYWMFVVGGGVMGGSCEIVSLKMWVSYVGGFIMFMGLMLFIIMLMVIWMSCKNQGALRIN